MQRKGLGMLLAAAAAYGYYRYSKMTPQQKSDMRTKAKGFVDRNLGGLGNLFGKKTTPTTHNGF
jgi:hypothetical protein